MAIPWHRQTLLAAIWLGAGLVTVGSSNAFAQKAVWKPESAGAALEQLQKMRAAAGKLNRFEADYLSSDVSDAFEKDERSRNRVYAEESSGYLIEIRPWEAPRGSARQAKSGRLCELSAREPARWLCVDDTCTRVDETERTYSKFDVRPGRFWAFFRAAPHQCLPPWLDPTIDWKGLKSRYRVKQASSTATEFFVDLVLDEKGKGAELSSDNRLNGSHQLIIDRKTALPKKWRSSGFPNDRIIIYTRIDLNPPKRELKISLAGCHEAQQIAQAAGQTASPTDDDEPLRTLRFAAMTFRVLTWCPF